jgi:hypothetical protein
MLVRKDRLPSLGRPIRIPWPTATEAIEDDVSRDMALLAVGWFFLFFFRSLWSSLLLR